jgi:light-regulated signal transduction histidine kinase (bacteriophytochrome)
LTLQHAIEAAARRAERLAALDAVAAGLAHEIRNPLGGIKGAAQLLRGSLDDPELVRCTDMIVREVERLKQLHDHDEEALFCGCCACNLRGSKTENERLIVELTHRVGWEERCLRAEAALEQISGLARVVQDVPPFVMADGVACETCHGPAQRWISSHVQPNATHAQNLANGMYATADDVQRARLCLSCHFGTADKFVDHRMISAGHPRLSFELDTFSQIEHSSSAAFPGRPVAGRAR